MKSSLGDIRVFFDVDEWEIIENRFSPERNLHSETVFSIGNGFIGTRGTFEEGLEGYETPGAEGTYLNGIYEEGIIRYGEIAYGFPEKSQTMVNAANAKRITLFLDGERFSMMTGEILEYRRSLNMREGVLKRNLIWKSPSGRKIKLEVERMVCLPRKNLAAIKYKVTPLNFEGEMVIISEIDGSMKNSLGEKDPRVSSGLEEGSIYTVNVFAGADKAAIVQRTRKTAISIACAVEGVLESGFGCSADKYTNSDRVGLEYRINCKANHAVTYTKFIAYAASAGSEHDVLDEAWGALEVALKDGYERLKQEQEDFLKEYWYRADVEIKGDPALQQAVRFNLFQLLQSVGRDGKTNICAKGLTGEGYEGHYFWDTEMYVVPAFLYSRPDISRKLLEYRYNTLDKARERAREMSHKKGALFPWRTINGEECSGYFPASTAQYHINADIAYAIKKYAEATQDIDFILNYGAEIVFETARLWVDLGFFNSEKEGKFCINCVTGPDEYTAIVNNNCYTNLMARENLNYACYIAEWMKKNHSEHYDKLANKIGLNPEEITIWKAAAENMYVPYSEKYGIHKQDDTFLEKQKWDFEGTPPENYPLLLHYHPLVIYRHQVCKQADVVLALFLLSHMFSKEQKRRDFDYYEKVTTHDSSLSTCIFSIVANEVGYHEKAYEYFIKTARLDLDDYHGNTHHGIHTANMAGSLLCIVNGFAGMRVFEDRIRFAPYIHHNWERYSFKVAYRGRLIKLSISHSGTEYELLEGEPLNIVHNEVTYLLKDRLMLE